MKHVLLAAFVCMLIGSLATLAEARGGLSLELQYWTFDESFDHDTHPDDQSFLQGRAGETSLGNPLAVALQYTYIVTEKKDGLYASLNGGVLLIGNAEEKRKNDNDSRSLGSHSEIYSRIEPTIGPLVGFDLGWKFSGKFYVGASLDASWISIEHGWNRYGEYQSEKDEWKAYVSAGPEFRYYFNESVSVSAGFNFGNASYGKLGLVLEF